MRCRHKQSWFDYDFQRKKGLIVTRADALYRLLTSGETIKEIDEDLSSYSLSAHQVRGTTLSKAHVKEAPDVHVQDHTMTCDQQGTSNSVAYTHDNLLEDADDML